ncbi:hypothetical protein F53441_5829 [Fusarium austroafricanum]|uniref:Thioesterase domain-containing protein n=1 Tax=Fusarium austroafricanum TaxID=2364996 RepID=A0A8H4KJ85_9HYPO|nr:hypothetical protein F53441_5829 [Fusarium austroafricanum]
MNRYTKACSGLGLLRNSRLTIDGQKRWVSYDKSELSQNALLNQVESELGRMASGKRARINAEKKTVDTDAGQLPISPLMDVNFLRRRRRVRKPEAGAMSGQFRKKLSNNPYASKTNGDTPAADTPTRRIQTSVDDILRETEEYTEEERTSKAEHKSAGTTEIDAEGRDMRQARVVAYTLARKSLIDIVGNSKFAQSRMAALRSGMAVSQSSGPGRHRVFRADMGDVLLAMLRRLAVDTLVLRSQRKDGRRPYKFIQPVFNWEEAKTVVSGGCILYIPKEDMGDINSYATLDVENANYGRKMAVHDLRYLLGEEELERLRTESWTFRNQELLVLKNFRSEILRLIHVESAIETLTRPTTTNQRTNQHWISTMDVNPEIVQPADWQAGEDAVPAFLLHDGGGTTFSYHCLEPLGRAVYGIHNPKFNSGEPFDGGLSDMARLYTGWIKETVETPDFPKRLNKDGKYRLLLGGWSMGGHLSLEIAKQLEDSNIEVIGILMVDTVYPHKYSSKTRKRPGEGTTEGKNKNQILADLAMADARRMIQAWTPPVWDEGCRPRISLLRAKEAVPMEGGGVENVDMSREERNLGWDMYDKNFFAEVTDIEGHHYEVYRFDFIPDVSEKTKKAFDELERVALKG